jgi:RNA polymerase sigma-70 factor (ECF subfamily)
VINTALDQFRKEKKFENQVPLELGNKEQINDSILDQLQADEILKMVQDLPENYRFTFNLFEIEGYSHEEIALKLGTTAATSRANLSRAKQMLRQMILILSEYERAI